MQSFDLIVLGTGVAAHGVATRCRSAGWDVAVADDRPFGGTCPLRGCDPKKVLVGAAAAVDHARRMHGKGVGGDSAIDWAELMAFKRTFTDPVPESREKSYTERGIAAFQGKARFSGSNSVEVEGESLQARHIVIATGAAPAPLGIAGEEHLATSDDFLALEHLPKRIVMVGGGYISAELSHIAARAGAEVSVLETGERMLSPFDRDLVGWLMDAFRRVGIDVHTKTAAQSIEKAGSGFAVTADADGQSSTFEADLVVHAAGRIPALAALDLDKAGVKQEDGRLVLNAFMQSVSNPAIYAAGDAAEAGPPLTPVSSHDAEVVAHNLLNGNSREPDYRGVPSVAFTIPPIAAVGMGEAEARDKGVKFRMQCRQAGDWYTARQAGEPVYGHKVLVEEGSGRILGAHLVGPHADELINLFALAIRRGLTADDLRETMFAYPTGASDVESMLG